MKEETIIGMPPGIGDLHWIMTKLESFKEKNNIQKIKAVMNLDWMTQHHYHTYSIDYLDLIPFIDSAESKEGVMPFEYALAGGSGQPLFKNVDGCDYIIEFNSRLEVGIKLKDILPEYETNFDYPIEKPPEAEEFATAIKETVGKKLVLLFGGSAEGNEIWARELWTPGHWLELAQKIYSVTQCKPVLVGAEYDKDYGQILAAKDHDKIILDMSGETSVAQLFALLRAADLVVAFQCGVMMMAVQFKTPTAAFWAIKTEANPEGQFSRGFMRSWLPPWAEGIGYHPFAFGDPDATPDGIFESIRRHL